MADVSLADFDLAAFHGDEQEIIEAGDIAAALNQVVNRWFWAMVDGSDEPAIVSNPFTMPTQYDGSSDLAVDITYYGSAAGGGNSLVFDAAFECISEGDAHDLHAGGDYFAGHQSVTDAVNATAGYENVARITFTNAQADAPAAGDKCRIVIRRDSDNGSDGYAATARITNIHLYQV